MKCPCTDCPYWVCDHRRVGCTFTLEDATPPCMVEETEETEETKETKEEQ